MATPEIHTYHCICNNLLLASTHTLSSLSRRKSPPSQDNSIILPLSSISPSSMPSTSTSTSTSTSKSPTTLPKTGHTTLLSLNRALKPTIIRKEDGFEKRFLYTCGRCGLVVGYELDAEHFPAGGTAAGAVGGVEGGMDVDGDGEGRVDILYVLPNGVMSTEVMAKGKVFREEDVALNGVGVAAWE